MLLRQVALAFLLTVLHGISAEKPPPSTTPSFLVRDFEALVSSNYTILRFAIQPTPGADFAHCKFRVHGSKVPRTACAGAHAVSGSLSPSSAEDGGGPFRGVRFQAWWAFSSHAAIWGALELRGEDFDVETAGDGTLARRYHGPREFGAFGKTVWALGNRVAGRKTRGSAS